MWEPVCDKHKHKKVKQNKAKPVKKQIYILHKWELMWYKIPVAVRVRMSLYACTCRIMGTSLC